MHSVTKSMKITRNYAVIYKTSHGSNDRSQKQIENEKNLTRGEFNGFISDKTARIIRRRIGTWVDAVVEADRRLNRKGELIRTSLTFITLTLCSDQIHQDNYIKRYMLNWFLKWLRESKGVETYYWKAENQKNGNIHFHILADRYINWQEIRSKWNQIQEHYGYIEQYRQIQKNWHKDGFKVRENLLDKWSKKNQLKAYQNGVKSNWSNPNSTDIHSLYNIKNPSSYIIKYMAKAEAETKVEGRLHGCSNNLKEIDQFEVEIDARMERLITDLINDKETNVNDQDHMQIISGNLDELIYKYNFKLYRKWKNYLYYTFRLLYYEKSENARRKGIENNRKIWSEYYNRQRENTIPDRMKIYNNWHKSKASTSQLILEFTEPEFAKKINSQKENLAYKISNIEWQKKLMNSGKKATIQESKEND